MSSSLIIITRLSFYLVRLFHFSFFFMSTTNAQSRHDGKSVPFDQGMNIQGETDRHEKEITGKKVSTQIPTMSSESPSNLPFFSKSSYPSQLKSSSFLPTNYPSKRSSEFPSTPPSLNPSFLPTTYPSKRSSEFPSISSSLNPSFLPTTYPSKSSSEFPSISPSLNTSFIPTNYPSKISSEFPSISSSLNPSLFSSSATAVPSFSPTSVPTMHFVAPPSSLSSNPTFHSNLSTFPPSNEQSKEVNYGGKNYTCGQIEKKIPKKKKGCKMCQNDKIKRICRNICLQCDTTDSNKSAAPSSLLTSSFIPSLILTSKPSIISSIIPFALPSTLSTFHSSEIPTNYITSLSPTSIPTTHRTTSIPSKDQSTFHSITPSLISLDSHTPDPSIIPTISPYISPKIVPSFPPSITPTNDLTSISGVPTSHSFTPSLISSRSPILDLSITPTISSYISPKLIPSSSSTTTPTNDITSLSKGPSNNQTSRKRITNPTLTSFNPTSPIIPNSLTSIVPSSSHLHSSILPASTLNPTKVIGNLSSNKNNYEGKGSWTSSTTITAFTISAAGVIVVCYVLFRVLSKKR